MSLRSERQGASPVEPPHGIAPQQRRSLLIVDHDRLLVSRLARGLEARGYAVRIAESLAEALGIVALHAPEAAIIETRLPDGSGLEVVEALHRARPEARALVLTGYGNIASAVAAIKRGAADYLAKPADLDEIDAVLSGQGDERPHLPERPMSADRVRWEHIQRIYELCDHNVSETARQLNMHRRTLQRILAKRAPR